MVKSSVELKHEEFDEPSLNHHQHHQHVAFHDDQLFYGVYKCLVGFKPHRTHFYVSVFAAFALLLSNDVAAACFWLSLCSFSLFAFAKHAVSFGELELFLLLGSIEFECLFPLFVVFSRKFFASKSTATDVGALDFAVIFTRSTQVPHYERNKVPS